MKFPVKGLALFFLPLLLSACGSNPTLGDQLVAQGESTRALGEGWNKGTSLISEGEKQRKRGRKMIEDGETLIKKGEKNIERGSKLKAEGEAAARA